MSLSPLANAKTIITGQQLGLLGGPLFTAIKVLDAIYYAKKMDGQAVYWLESNDADFEEINKIYFLNDYQKLTLLKWDKKTQGMPCGSIKIDQKLIDTIDRFFNTLAKTSSTQFLKEIVFKAYQIGETLLNASKALANHLFQNFSLTLFDPSEDPFRNFSQSILLKESESTLLGNQANLFVLIGQQRKAVFRRKTGFTTRKGKQLELKNEILLPNVKTRSLCQDAYFNTHTYIAGPSEMKYLKEFRTIYQKHHVKPSKLKQRLSITMITESQIDWLSNQGIERKKWLSLRADEMKRIAFKKITQYDFPAIKQNVMREKDIYVKKIAKVMPKKMQINEIKKFEKDLFHIKKAWVGKTRALVKKRYSSELKTLEQLTDFLKPANDLQERKLNLIYCMNQYGGMDFINTLYQACEKRQSLITLKK